MTGKGRLIGVGTGPGDPELLTLKAVRALARADVVAHFAKRGNHSNARRTVSAHLGPGITELPLLYPVTTEIDSRHADYRNIIGRFHEESASAVRKHLDSGRIVAILSEGDPLFYGSYIHLHIRLASHYPTEIIPGITAMSGGWSQAGLPIVQGNDTLTVFPGTMDEREMARRLADADAAVIMKVGRNLPKIRRAIMAAGRLGGALYVERATMNNTFSTPLAAKAGDDAPYFSIILIPGQEHRP